MTLHPDRLVSAIFPESRHHFIADCTKYCVKAANNILHGTFFTDFQGSQVSDFFSFHKREHDSPRYGNLEFFIGNFGESSWEMNIAPAQEPLFVPVGYYSDPEYRLRLQASASLNDLLSNIKEEFCKKDYEKLIQTSQLSFLSQNNQEGNAAIMLDINLDRIYRQRQQPLLEVTFFSPKPYSRLVLQRVNFGNRELVNVFKGDYEFDIDAQKQGFNNSMQDLLNGSWSILNLLKQ